MRLKLQTGTRICIECGRSETDVPFRHGNQCRECINRILRENRKSRKTQIKEAKARYYHNRRDEMLQQQAEYRKENSEKCRARSIRYGSAHKQQRAIYASMRYGMKKARMKSPNDTKPIYERARNAKRIRCYICGRLVPIKKRHVDHIFPLSKGGLHVSENLGIACASCNESKRDKHPRQVGLLLWG